MILWKKDLGPTPSTHNAVYNYNSSSGKSDALFQRLREPGTQVVQIYLGKTPIYKTTIKKPFHFYQNKLLLYYSKTHSTQFPLSATKEKSLPWDCNRKQRIV